VRLVIAMTFLAGLLSAQTSPSIVKSPVQIEPVYCSESRVIDAAAWTEKARAQLSVLSHPEAEAISKELESITSRLLDDYKELGRGGSAVTESAHQMMVSHSLLEAASHAWYVQSPEASALLREARDTLTSSQTFVAHSLPWKMPALGQIFKPSPFATWASSNTIEWISPQATVFEIGDDAGPAVTISMNGKVTLGKGFTADEASRLFWRKIAEAYPSVCALKKDSR